MLPDDGRWSVRVRRMVDNTEMAMMKIYGIEEKAGSIRPRGVVVHMYEVHRIGLQQQEYIGGRVCIPDSPVKGK